MPSTYPSGLDSWATGILGSDSESGVHAALHNNISDAVNKIEAELGTNPSKSAGASTVSVRLAAIDQRPPVIVATADASATQQKQAQVILPASGAAGLGAAIKSAIETYQVVKFAHAGNQLVLDAGFSVAVSPGMDVDFSYLPLVVPVAENQGGSAGVGAVIFNSGSQSTVSISGLPTTIAQGVDTISHTQANLASTLSPGDWVAFTSTEIHNPNRPLEYFKGEMLQVETVSGTSLRVRGVTRDTYTTSALTVRKLPMVGDVTVRRPQILSNTSGTGRQNGLILRWLRDPMLWEPVTSGDELCDAIGIWGCIGGATIRPHADHVLDRYGPGVQGYGMRLAGSESHWVFWPDFEDCRHGIDMGMSSSSWTVTRTCGVFGGQARHTYAAGFAIHDAEDCTIMETTSLQCGGGIITRAPGTKIIRPVIRGGQAETYPYGSGTQATTAAIWVGERKKLTLTTFDDTASDGRAGENLQIIDPIIDVGSANADFHGIACNDPLTNAIVHVATPMKVRRLGFATTGDTTVRSVIDIRVDHTGSYSAAGAATITGATCAASTDIVTTGSAHGLSVGNQLMLTAIATGAAPLYAGGTYFVYSVGSSTTFQLAGSSSGNTAPIDITSDGTGLSFAVGQPVNSLRIAPSVTTTAAVQHVQDCEFKVWSTGARDTAAFIGGARNAGVNTRNKTSLTAVALGSGATSSTPMLSFGGAHTDLEVTELRVPSTLRASAVQILGTLPRLLWRWGWNAFSDAALLNTGLIRDRGPSVQSATYHVTDHSGVSTVTLVAGDSTTLRLYRVRVLDKQVNGIAVATSGTQVALGTSTYARVRVGVFADVGDGSAPSIATGNLLQDLGVIDITGAVGDKTLAITAVGDWTWDPTGVGYYWLGAAFQTDGTPTTFPTLTSVSTLTPMSGPTTIGSATVRGFTGTPTYVSTLSDLTAIARDGTGRFLTGLKAV